MKNNNTAQGTHTELQKKFKRKLRMNFIRQLLLFIITISIGVAFILFKGISIYHIKGNGMQCELPNGSYALGNNLAYYCNSPARGDIISTKDGHIYRIIGLPGEEISFNGGFVYANETLLNESQYFDYTDCNQVVAYSDEVYKIPKNQYFVLNDNRNNFDDSRTGSKFVKVCNIKSKIFFSF